MIYNFVSQVNSVLWGSVLVYLLIAVGIWFSVRLGLLQLRHFGHMFALLKGSRHSDERGISSFQALCTSLSARVGTGNLAGVAIAISLGGPGAIFWMWVIAFLGMATAYAESLLAQVYKVHDSNGEFRGGPAYYIQLGLNQRWLAVLFSLSLLFGYGFVFSAVQANTIADALNNTYQFPVMSTAAVVTVLAALIVIGGLRSIGRFAEIVVPFMGLAFVLTALTITFMNISLVPDLLLNIVTSAFGWQEAGAGTFAAALKNGIQRGLYSNEAGAGSVPQAAASAAPNPNHPASQGYLQMLGVFFDTMVVCTCTALVILLAQGGEAGDMEGIRLTQRAMVEHIGPFGSHFVALAICLFGFTSIVGNYAYAESNLHFFKLDHRWGRHTFTLIFLSMMFIGCRFDLVQVWATADMAFGLMAVINVVALLFLTRTIIAVTNDYQRQRGSANAISFRVADCKVQGKTEDSIW
ncbi:alanine/glycine:cation symporter family protein [Arenicella xantha]|uniref:AGCS family alanine or glycine:cation symporter n=1 Tax=Arenicella xantha TaxID=644221 RepID=A0A395JQW1_9GAMM|nr:alanine/glycine:cation symporter family protein [Arenicella xantha]RBP52836.1 AGCS family alanine or glycine:cation symporter [Arenicella xantha]